MKEYQIKTTFLDDVVRYEKISTELELPVSQVFNLFVMSSPSTAEDTRSIEMFELTEPKGDPVAVYHFQQER